MLFIELWNVRIFNICVYFRILMTWRKAIKKNRIKNYSALKDYLIKIFFTRALTWLFHSPRRNGNVSNLTNKIQRITYSMLNCFDVKYMHMPCMDGGRGAFPYMYLEWQFFVHSLISNDAEIWQNIEKFYFVLFYVYFARVMFLKPKTIFEV